MSVTGSKVYLAFKLIGAFNLKILLRLKRQNLFAETGKFFDTTNSFLTQSDCPSTNAPCGPQGAESTS